MAQSQDRLEDRLSLISLETGQMVPQAVVDPTPPARLPEAKVEVLRDRAEALIRQLESAEGSKELELIDSVIQLGLQAQREAGAGLDLFRGRVGEMVAQGGAGAEIVRDLTELRLTLSHIDPQELRQRGFLSRIFGWLKPALRVLEKIALRYESVSRQVAVIETRLCEGRMMLSRDNIELRKLYEQVEAQQVPIQKNVYLGELVMQQLDGALQRTQDPLKAERLRNVLYDVSIRVQDLRTMETVHEQFFVSIEMTRQNNTRLSQAVERTLSLAANVMLVGLAIQTALARQKRVQEATQQTRGFLGSVIAANATAIKKHTEEIGDIYNEPVIALEKIAHAHRELLEALDMAKRLKQEGIDAARSNIAKLAQLSADLQQRVSVGDQADVAPPDSFEA